MTPLLIIASLLAAFFAIPFLSNATSGVGIIGIACLCAILARIAQSSAQHKELIKEIKDKNSKDIPSA